MNQLWPALKEQFEARSPYKRALLNNKARNQVFVEKLPVEYILTTDARLRARLPTEQLNLPFWFRHPYATIVLVTCEVSLIIIIIIPSNFYSSWSKISKVGKPNSTHSHTQHYVPLAYISRLQMYGCGT